MTGTSRPFSSFCRPSSTQGHDCPVYGPAGPASSSPDAWFLSKVFTAGFGHGLVQAVSNIAMYELAAVTGFPPPSPLLCPASTSRKALRTCSSTKPDYPEYWDGFDSSAVQGQTARDPIEPCIAEIPWLSSAMLRTFVDARSFHHWGDAGVCRPHREMFFPQPAGHRAPGGASRLPDRLLPHCRLWPQ